MNNALLLSSPIAITNFLRHVSLTNNSLINVNIMLVSKDM